MNLIQLYDVILWFQFWLILMPQLKMLIQRNFIENKTSFQEIKATE